MKRVLPAVLVAIAAAAAVVTAQTQLYTHPGKVRIQSTASDALQVLGGAGIGVALPANNLEVRSTVDGVASGGIRVSRGDGSYLILNMDDGGASAFGTIQAGDGSAFRPLRLNPSGGQVHLANGSASAPALTFASDSDTGVWFGSSSYYVAVDGATVTRTYRGTSTSFSVEGGAFGAGAVQGARLDLGRNSSNNGAPGCIAFIDKAGATQNLFPDSTGVLRIVAGLGGCPTESGGDTVGTVVGTQTSTRASKNIARQVNAFAPAAMDLIRQTPVYEFTYKNGAFNGETFYGITTDDSPLFGMDHGKSFNPVNAFGATVLALQDTDKRVQALEAQLREALAEIAALKGRHAPARGVKR